jgi:hypothetical protein
MAKKLMTGLLALVALAALALPAVASASPELGETSGGAFTRIAVGSKIVGTQLGVSKMTSPGGATLTECEEGFMTGEVKENSGTSIKGEISEAKFTNKGGAACSTFFGGTANVTTNVGNGTPWCLQSLKEDKFEVKGGACGTSRTITFVLDTSTAGVCKYDSTTFPVGTFTTDVAGNEQDAKLNLTKAGLWKGEAGNGFLCPGEANLDMEFTLETDGGSTPLYIK